MKQFTREYDYSFTWCRTDGGDLIEKHIFRLDEFARKIIMSQLRKGLFEGKLLNIIIYGRKKLKIEYTGSFTLKIITS